MSNDLILDCLLSVIQMLAYAVMLGWLIVLAHREAIHCLSYLCQAGAMFSLILGNLFLVLYLVLRDAWPVHFSAADVAWVGYYFFMVAVIHSLQIQGRGMHWLGWLLVALPLTTHLMTALLYGKWLADLLWGLVYSYYAYEVGRFLSAVFLSMQKNMRPFGVALALSIVVQMAMFLSWDMVYVALDGVQMCCMLGAAILLTRGLRQA